MIRLTRQSHAPPFTFLPLLWLDFPVCSMIVRVFSVFALLLKVLGSGFLWEILVLYYYYMCLKGTFI